MIEAKVTSNVDKVLAEFTIVSQGIADKAAVRALNRAADSTRTAGKREVTKIYNVKSRSANEQFAITRAFPGNLRSLVTVRGKPIPLYEFDAKWKQGQPGGTSVKVRRDGGRKIVPHTFVARMRSGKIGVFERKGSGRLPIRMLYSIGLPRMFLNRVVQKSVKQVAAESFEKNFRQQVKYLTTGGR